MQKTWNLRLVGSKPLVTVWLNASGDTVLVTVLYSNDRFTVPISIPHTEKVSRTLYGKAQITRSQKLFISTMRRRVGNILKPEPKSETKLGQKCFNIWNSQSPSLKSLHPTLLSHFSTHLFLFLSLLLSNIQVRCCLIVTVSIAVCPWH